jgi:hypothetical protein
MPRFFPQVAPRRAHWLAALALLLFATASAAAQSAPPAAPGDAASTTETVTLDLNKLLANPIADQDPFFKLLERRRWLAHQNGDPATFAGVADEFDAMGAYYPAIELLWFAEKLTDNPARREAFNARMLEIKEKHSKNLERVEGAKEAWAAEPFRAIDELKLITVEQPYNEIAHYQLGYHTWLAFLAQEEATDGTLDLDLRARLFRVCYAAFVRTIVIDPLYNDAYYQLNQVRAILAADNPDFTRVTAPLTERALTFRTETVPALAAIDDGDRSAAAFVRAAEALDAAGQYAYAAYSCQTALAHAADNPQLTIELKEKLDTLLREKLKLTP